MIKQQKIRRLVNLSLASSLGFLLFWFSLSWLYGVAQAAPPEIPLLPSGLINPAGWVISATKTSTPTNVVNAGSVLTYAIVFTSDINSDTVIVTDNLPEPLLLKLDTITGTPAVSITSDIQNDVITWTVGNIAFNDVVTLTFAATVPASISTDMIVTNTAWLSGTTDKKMVTSTPITLLAPVSSSTYLPVVLKNYICSLDQYEPNNGRSNKAEAYQWTFGSGGTISGNFCTAFDDPADYFWLDLTSGTLDIWLYPPSTADYDVYIYKGINGSLQMPYGNTTGLGVTEHIVYSIPGPDTYFIRVHPYIKGTNGDSYSLKVTYSQ